MKNFELIKHSSDGEIDIFTKDGFHYHLFPSGQERYSLLFQRSKGVRGRKIRYILSRINPEKKRRKKYNYHLEIVLFNLFSAWEVSQILDKTVVVKYTRDKNLYTNSGLSYSYMMDVIEDLKIRGFLEYVKGSFNNETRRGYRGYMIPTQKVGVLNSLETIDHAKDKRIILKDRDGFERSFTSTEMTKQYENTLNRLSKLIEEHDIKISIPMDSTLCLFESKDRNIDEVPSVNAGYKPNTEGNTNTYSGTTDDYYVTHTTNGANKDPNSNINIGEDPGHNAHLLWNIQELINLQMVFNHDFDHGGRIYYSAQNLRKEFRPYIKIDDQPTIALDYGGLHYRILYAREGIDYQDDPYKIEVIGWNNDDSLRKAIKITGQCILNASNRLSAKRALQNKINKRKLVLENGFKPDHLINAFIANHQPISKYFFSGEGIILQNEDKDLAIAICQIFIDQNRPILPIHDGFVVIKHDEDLLREAMSKSYINKYGFIPVIKKEYDATEMSSCVA